MHGYMSNIGELLYYDLNSILKPDWVVMLQEESNL
jgi:hypothetical protein